MTSDSVTRRQTWPRMGIMSLGRGMRGSSQRHGGVLPVVRVISRVMRGLGLSLRHTQQLGITHPLWLRSLMSVARGH